MGNFGCGEKYTVTTQLLLRYASENGDPAVELQLSCSVKFGTLLKSLGITGRSTVRLFKSAPEEPGFVSARIVWLVAAGFPPAEPGT